LGLLLLIPAFELLLFGYAINTVVDHVPLVVFDATNDSDSRGLLKALVDSAYFDLRVTATSYDEAVGNINDGRAKAALIIPANFGSSILRGDNATAQLLVDGTDPNTAQAALFAA